MLFAYLEDVFQQLEQILKFRTMGGRSQIGPKVQPGPKNAHFR